MVRSWVPRGCLAAGCLLVSVILASGAPAPVAVVRVDKWEYCEIQYSSRTVRTGVAGAPAGAGGKGKAAVARTAQTTVLWVTAEEEVEAAGWEEMAQKMKAPPGKKDATESAQKMRVLNYMGSQGWELVSHHIPTSTIRPSVWTFKRKAGR